MSVLEKLLREAALEGVIHCPECGNVMEPDADSCVECDWKNVLKEGGWV